MQLSLNKYFFFPRQSQVSPKTSSLWKYIIQLAKLAISWQQIELQSIKCKSPILVGAPLQFDS